MDITIIINSNTQITIFMPDKKLNLRVHIKNAIKFYAWVILAYSIWLLSIFPWTKQTYFTKIGHSNVNNRKTIGDFNSFWVFLGHPVSGYRVDT